MGFLRNDYILRYKNSRNNNMCHNKKWRNNNIFLLSVFLFCIFVTWKLILV